MRQMSEDAPREKTGSGTLGAEPPAEPAQYYSRSELPQSRAELHRLSPNRKSTQIAMALLITLGLAIAAPAVVIPEMGTVQRAIAATGGDPAVVRMLHELAWKSGLMATGGVAALMLSAYLLVRLGVRVVALEGWVRRMGAGDLAYTLRPTGNDEVTEVFYDLEVLRRRSMRSQQLDVVQELSEELQVKNDELEHALDALQAAQDQVISRQKLAELGELTAGVAHEIRNPLNLVQNFARTSASMMQDLTEVIGDGEQALSEDDRDEVVDLVRELTENMQRIREHGDRANRIVHDMLAMGRSSRGQFQEVEVNRMVEDHTMLAYHAVRNRDQSFNMRIERDLDENIGTISLISEDIGRVILNLVSNACYATRERANRTEGHTPAMRITTRRADDHVSVSIHDNGGGIPDEIADRIFNPFFTTKPPNEGTGLGLSLSNDIVREHGGELTFVTEPGESTEFTIRLPISVRKTKEDAP